MTTLRSTTSKCIHILSLPLLLVFSHNSFSLGFDDDDVHEQDFLFILEEGYTQEKGEWQFGLSFQNAIYQLATNQKNSTDNAWDFGVEYGFTDHFQIEFSLPYQQSTLYQSDGKSTASTMGNPEVELIYQVVQESKKLPAISMGVGIDIAASSNKDPIRSEEWGYESFVHTSKYFDDVGFFHANLAYGVADKGDVTEISYGIGFVRPFTENFSGMIEYLVEKETENTSISSESETLGQFAVGLSYQDNKGLVAGVGYGQSDNDESLEHAVTIKLQYEF